MARPSTSAKRRRDRPSNEIYRCDECTYQTPRPSDLRRHKMVHLDPALKRKHKCPFARDGCLFATAQRSNVRIHVNARHETKKLYFCTVSDCQKHYTNPSSLSRHLRDVHNVASRRKRSNQPSREPSTRQESLASSSSPATESALSSPPPLAIVESPAFRGTNPRLLNTEKPLPPLPPPPHPVSPIPTHSAHHSQASPFTYMRCTCTLTRAEASQVGPSRHGTYGDGREVHRRDTPVNFPLTRVRDERFTGGPHLSPPQPPTHYGLEERRETLPRIRDVFSDLPWPSSQPIRR